MTKTVRDKLIAVLGAGLLGYYLSLSLFRGLIWDGLIKFLPAINSRHLPDKIYIGLLGAVVGGIVTYILFNLYIERRSFKTHKQSYLIALVLLIIAPLLIVGIFRVHALSIVTKQEGTTPTQVTIRVDDVGNSIMFATSSSSAGGIDKSIFVPEPYLDEFGQRIRDLKFVEVLEREKQMDTPYSTIWINYRAEGKWYSKIMRYNQGLFSEAVAGQRMAYYTNPQLEELIERLMLDAADINNYNQARIYNTLTFNEKLEPKKIIGEDFQRLVGSLRPENLIKQDTEGVKRIKSYQERKQWVPKEERDIYGIDLWQKGSEGNMGRNFMVYDKLTKTLMFEGKYYQVDLGNLVH
ncbi:MAG: hypothetical protein GX923_03085 [Clostridia bacterium]|nr:hypothetical protein [Clostridia bacterium]